MSAKDLFSKVWTWIDYNRYTALAFALAGITLFLASCDILEPKVNSPFTGERVTRTELDQQVISYSRGAEATISAIQSEANAKVDAIVKDASAKGEMVPIAYSELDRQVDIRKQILAAIGGAIPPGLPGGQLIGLALTLGAGGLLGRQDNRRKDVVIEKKDLVIEKLKASGSSPTPA